LIGEGRKFDWVKNQVKINNLKNVFVLGRHPIESMPLFFRKASVMLLTLKTSAISDLTVPAKLQAYLASGKIILGAINGEANSIINDNNIGLACKSGDFESLAKNALLLKRLTPGQRIKIENNSKNLYYSQFSKKLLLNGLEELFKSDCIIE
jgi:glycosyltransferase involved in cell wall biosynthesis